MQKKDISEEKFGSPDIAIIGMSCRFPGAKNISDFWDNLLKGKESVKQLTDQEILESGVESSYLDNSSYVKASPVLDGPGLFDAPFFGFTSSEALR
ncbi:MAG TPA: beta-ketoacyl synthase N-terminal-like domain-containing protein, partial [Ignavibacteriaceae bacterium]|nr:beta-ketoacyl synthase N-terminal-like domain-containing protein [Ignavibacteriaceae bacterium]